MITLNIGDEEFDAILGRDDETAPTIFLDFLSGWLFKGLKGIIVKSK